MTPVDPGRTRPRRRHPRRARRLTGVALVALVAPLLLGACSSDPPDPAEARMQRVEERLRSSFSARQARCIIEQLDDTVVRALDRPGELAPDSPALQAYSAALQVCVNGGTTTAPATGGSGSTVTTTTDG